MQSELAALDFCENSRIALYCVYIDPLVDSSQNTYSFYFQPKRLFTTISEHT